MRENGRNAWTIKAAIVLCSLCLGNPAGRCERWQKGRSETAAVTRLDISWLKPLVLLVPVEQRVPHKMHMHMWCGTVDRVYKRWEEWCSCAVCPHNCWASYVCMSTMPLLPPLFLFFIFNLLKQGLAHHSCVCHMYSLVYFTSTTSSPEQCQPKCFPDDTLAEMKHGDARQDEPTGSSWGRRDIWVQASIHSDDESPRYAQ